MLTPLNTFQLEQTRSFYNRFTNKLSDEVWNLIHPFHQLRMTEKGEVLVATGQICDWFALVLEGTFRYFHQVKDKEVVGEFYLPGNTISSFSSYITGLPSRITVDSLEKGALVVISKEAEQSIAALFPDYYRVSKLVKDKLYITNYQRYITHLLDNAETRYLHLLKQRPELLQSVHQYMIASYLGITPEAFSRIRKKIATEKLEPR